MEIGDILAALERFAPLSFQEDYDNAGLQLGLTKVEATGVLLCLDITEDVIDEAVACGCNLVVSHHPLVFRPIKSITGRNYVERCIIKAIKNDIAIYSAHTNLDNILNGVNSEIACRLGLSNLRILRPVTDALMKLITFVPSAHLESVRNALPDAERLAIMIHVRILLMVKELSVHLKGQILLSAILIPFIMKKRRDLKSCSTLI